MNQQLILHKYPTLNSGIDEVIDNAMGVKLKFNPDYYRILSETEIAQ